MKLALVVIGAALILFGLLAFAGIGFTTERTKVEVGPFEATVRQERTVPPLVAGAAIVLGLGVLVSAVRRPR